MKWLIVLFIVGLVLGFALFFESPPTGAAIHCFLDNEPCACEGDSCVCGNTSIDAAYCRAS